MKTGKENTSLVDMCVHRLRTVLDANKPLTISSLSRQWGVSRPTLRKAVNILREEGILDRAPGIRSRKNSPDSDDETSSSRVRLAEELRTAILGGIYREEAALPKFEVIASEYRVSRTTVAGAVEILAAEDLVRKEGRKWIVHGATGSARITGNTVLKGTVVLLMQGPRQWFKMASNPRIASFCDVFTSEVQKSRHLLKSALLKEAVPCTYGLPTGLAQTLQYIGKLKEGYRGALVTVQTASRLKEWLPSLTRLGRPVVIFHIVPQTTESSLQLESYPGVTHVYSSERRIVETALETIVQAGHRNIGYPIPADTPWIWERYNLLSRTASAEHSSVRISCAAMDPAFWDEMRNEGFLEAYERLRKTGLPHMRATAAEFIHRARTSPSFSPDWPSRHTAGTLLSLSHVLVPLIRDMNVTALIAPNDHWASAIYSWLSAARVRIPKDISIISFDNHIRYRGVPVSTVDMGYGTLGYTTFQTFLSSDNVKKAPSAIVSRPFTVLRGSISTPNFQRDWGTLYGELR